MKVAYISGPMAGQPELNLPLFREASWRLKRDGWESVIIPHDVNAWQHAGKPCPGGYRSEGADHSAACYLRTDLIAMLGQADAIYMLPGWELSVGARLEMQVAATCGLPVRFLHGFGCAHVAFSRSRCGQQECWNHVGAGSVLDPIRPEGPDVASAVRRTKSLDQVHTREEIAAALVRPGEARRIAAAACTHPLTQFGNEAFCKVETCPNYYLRNVL